VPTFTSAIRHPTGGAASSDCPPCRASHESSAEIYGEQVIGLPAVNAQTIGSLAHASGIQVGSYKGLLKESVAASPGSRDPVRRAAFFGDKADNQCGRGKEASAKSYYSM